MLICCHDDAKSTVNRADTAGMVPGLKKVPCLPNWRAFLSSVSVTGDGNVAEGCGMEALEGWVMETVRIGGWETRGHSGWAVAILDVCLEAVREVTAAHSKMNYASARIHRSD
jgi:hypothetical protein